MNDLTFDGFRTAFAEPDAITIRPPDRVTRTAEHREDDGALDRLPERHGFTAVANTNSAGHSNQLPLRYGASEARYSPATFARTSGAKSDHG